MPSLIQLKRDKSKLQSRKKQVDTFLKEIRAAKKQGFKKAKMGTKTYTIDSLITKGNKAKKIAINKLNKIERAIAKKVKQ